MTEHEQSPNIISVEIDDRVKSYLFWTIMLVSVVSVIGIPLIPISAAFFWVWYAPRYKAFHTLELTETGVQSKRGVVFRSQTNVPLDRITDVSVHQGPLMRYFGVYKVTVESAGQTQLQGAASIIGVTEPYTFRDAVLENVELLKQRTSRETSRIDDTGTATSTTDTQTELLIEIRDILARMAAKNVW